MAEIWYRIFWKRDSQADRVNSAFRRGVAIGALLALLATAIVDQLAR